MKLTAVLLCFFFYSVLLNAQETNSSDSLQNLKEVIVTYQADKHTPVTFQNIRAKEVKLRLTGQEPSFLLTETPSITNFSDAGSSQGYSYFRMRGIDQTRINITLDGVPLNEPEDQGAYFSNLPDLFNSVSQIQLQRGVSTSKNGMASYAGSIQLFSPDLTDSSGLVGGIGWGSFNSMRVFGEYKSGLKNKKAIYLRASHIQSDGYKYHSDNNSQSIFLSTGLFKDKSLWKLNLVAGNQRNGLAWIGVADSLISRDRKTNANSQQEKDRFFQLMTQVQNGVQFNKYAALRSSVYYSFLTGSYDFDLNNFLGLPSTSELYRYAVQSNLLGFFSNFSYSKNRAKLTLGIHGNSYNRQHTGSEKLLGQLYQNTGNKNELSGFVKGELAHSSFRFFTDMQYRFVQFNYTGSVPMQALKWQFLNPKIGMSWIRNASTTWYYSLGYSGREPTRNDMFGGNDDLLADSTGQALLFNTDPEYVFDQELGIRVAKKNWKLDINLYFMRFKNEIVLDGKFGPNGLALTNNVENSFRTGLEWSFTYRISRHLQLVNNSSLNYSRIKEKSTRFSPILTPPVLLNQEFLYNREKLTMSLSGRYQQGAYIDYANTVKLRSYFLMNSRASYQFPKLQVSLFLNNLLNTSYFNQGYIDFDGTAKYFVQAPFHFYASIQYNFN
jgi:iron complex outermembrane receptor protein